MARALTAALVLALGGTLSTALTAHASGDTEVFDSTNTSTQTVINSAAAANWWAYKFSAFDSTTVERIDVYVTSATGYTDFFVGIGTAFNAGSLGAFTPTVAESGLTCGGRPCARVSFTGSVQLSGANDYWLWIGSNSGTFASTDLFINPSSAATGLALGYTFATNDIKTSNGVLTLNSNVDGLPWVRMFTTSSTEAAPSTVRTVHISLASPPGVECSTGSVSGLAGTWAQLPASFDCVDPTVSADSLLLGWATSAEFPLAIAQRQVDNGWGAYETKNDAGQLTGVFIPAGGYTLLSNDTNLYPIWS